MKCDPKIHHRKSIRLSGYDYSQAGLYFITICIQNRKCLFGEIMDGAMASNGAGKMVKNEWLQLPQRFTNIKLHEYIVMPNHFHAILEIVGVTLVVAQNDTVAKNTDAKNNTVDSEKEKGQPQGIAPTNKTVGDMIGAFESITTVEYIRGVKTNGWRRFDKKLWQRNYWEHIIRNENEYKRITEYIINNSMKWDMDKLNDGDGNMVMESQPQYTVWANICVRPNKEEWMI
ncbi:MAG: transposase [Candidatus Anammoxibacter sp.]